jgi:putative membrane protein
VKLGMSALALLGVFGGVALVAYFGVADIAQALAIAGWSGLAAITLYHLVPLALCGLAWRMQLRRPPAGALRFIWFRWMRDAGGDLLGMVPAGGELIGIRAMRLAGVPLGLAAALTVVDLTLEMCGQIAFTLLGLAILVVERPEHRLVTWAIAGLSIVVPLVAAFALAQRFGLFRLLERLALRLAAERGWVALARARGIHDEIHRIYADYPRPMLAFAVHCAAWIAGVGEAGIALYLMGVPLGFRELVVLESLSYALRSATFFVPAAAGVQEAGYVLPGGLFGLSPEFALALSLLKRGRELVLGTLGLLIWHSAEGGRLWQKMQTAIERD